jgi:pilus assembly protein CpaB
MIPFAVLLGAVTSFAAYKYLEYQKNGLQRSDNSKESVVVAKNNLGVGTLLHSENIEEVQWPVELIPSGSFSSIGDLDGRVVKIDVFAKEAIIESKLAPEGSSSGFSARIPVGKRAATVPVNVVSGVSGFILPKTSVDVLVTVAQPSKKDEATTKVILENIEVLAVGQIYQTKDDDPITVQSITLLVTQEESEKLALASNEGKLSLTLRNSADSTKTDDLTGIRLRDLIAQKRKTSSRPVYRSTTQAKSDVVEIKPVILPPQVVEIIRANERSEELFLPADSTKKNSVQKKKKVK